MNIINVTIDFTKGINKLTGINLITGDYESTKMVFQFDRTDGTKVLEMKNPSGEVVYFDEIINNEVILAAFNEGLNYSIFNEAGRYIYEVSLYNGDSKLTSVKGELPVQKEQVIIDGEVIEPYLPYFDRLMQEINTAITETNNLNVAASKVDTTTTITITKKDGTSYDVEVLDGEQGPQGEPGVPGAVKFVIVNELPTENIQTDTIYLVPSDDPTTQDLYKEYMYINNAWELLGQKQIVVDLTDYVKFTDYATSQKGGVIKLSSSYGYDMANGMIYPQNYNYVEYGNKGNHIFISKGTLENVITGKGLVSNTNYANTTTGGVLKTSGAYGLQVNGTNGIAFAVVKNYNDYNSSYNEMFISKGTLENVITGKGLTTKSYVDDLVGNIQTLLDNLDSGNGV